MALCQASFVASPSFFARFGSIVGIAKSGEKKTISFNDDDNAFKVLTEAGIISKAGTCMGNMSCGKCRVHVSGKVPAASDDEKELLEGAPKGARLACAITLKGDCDGAEFKAI